MPKNKNVQEKLSALPSLPGVYLMKNVSGSIIYVGKSKSLKNRVSSYFQSPEKLNPKTRKLVNNIVDFEIIVTQTEAEALILENELIKKHLPKYNIKLKDSKSYPYIKVTNHAYPKLIIAHTHRDDKCKYFGPYTSASAAKDIIKTINKIFKLPSCEKNIVFGKPVGRPCLNFHIDQCMAPCTGKISEQEYADVLSEVEMILKGDYSGAKKSLEEKMLIASEQLQFESAAKYRDSIKNLERLSVHQKIKSHPGTQKDVFGYFETPTHSAVAILLLRDGVIIDKNIIHINCDEIVDADSLTDLILRYYSVPDTIPKQISLSFSLDDEIIQSLSHLLSEKAGHTISITIPKIGQNKKLCDMAVENAYEAIATRVKQEENDSQLLIRFAQLLELEVVPERIESYDISNSGESDIYCGMIVIENGRFKKSDYRAFSIKSTNGIDDYNSMREALTRRFDHLSNPSDISSMAIKPDLILLDGGAGHVSVIKQIAKDMNITIPIYGMVKDKFHKTRTITDGVNEISIAKDSQIFSFIYKIQEEVHRFTFSKMDASRRKKMKKLELTNIKGIGEAKAKALYTSFKTLDELKKANIEQLCEIKGINPETAKNIIKYLKSETES